MRGSDSNKISLVTSDAALKMKKKQKNFLRTDVRTTQNYSSEPHKKA